MDLPTYRESRSLTQEQAAESLGIRSKGYFSRLERGLVPWPLRLALQVERWSAGQVTAASLVSEADQQLLADFIARGRQADAASQGAAA